MDYEGTEGVFGPAAVIIGNNRPSIKRMDFQTALPGLETTVSYHSANPQIVVTGVSLSTRRELEELIVPRRALFSRADEGKTLGITNGNLIVDGVEKTVEWITAKHPGGSAKIASVEPKAKGIVMLDDHTEFENPGRGGIACPFYCLLAQQKGRQECIGCTPGYVKMQISVGAIKPGDMQVCVTNVLLSNFTPIARCR